MRSPLLEISGITKKYGGLRPFRLEQLTILHGEQLAILGLDKHTAEVLVHLITGTTLPDSGEVRIAGRATAAIGDGAEWLATADRFGLVSERVVLLDTYTVLQNIALSYSVEIDPMPADVREKAAAAAREVGISSLKDDSRLADVSSDVRFRVRVSRAFAFEPQMLLLEHPSVGLERTNIAAIARELQGLVARRGIAALTCTADEEFAGIVAARVLALDPASGKLSPAYREGWFGRKRRKS